MARAYCTCPAFGQLVEAGIIKENTHQVFNSRTGKLTYLHYYFIGPKRIQDCLVFPYGPACGRRVKVNAKFEKAIKAISAPATGAAQ